MILFIISGDKRHEIKYQKFGYDIRRETCNTIIQARKLHFIHSHQMNSFTNTYSYIFSFVIHISKQTHFRLRSPKEQIVQVL